MTAIVPTNYQSITDEALLFVINNDRYYILAEPCIIFIIGIMCFFCIMMWCQFISHRNIFEKNKELIKKNKDKKTMCIKYYELIETLNDNINENTETIKKFKEKNTENMKIIAELNEVIKNNDSDTINSLNDTITNLNKQIEELKKKVKKVMITINDEPIMFYGGVGDIANIELRNKYFTRSTPYLTFIQYAKTVCSYRISTDTRYDLGNTYAFMYNYAKNIGLLPQEKITQENILNLNVDDLLDIIKNDVECDCEFTGDILIF